MEPICTGSFPSTDLSASEADSLLRMFEDQTWWSLNPTDYPRLPCASRGQAAWKILERINLAEAWQGWGIWDKFCCLYATLASAAPFINCGDAEVPEYSAENTDLLTNLMINVFNHMMVDLKNSDGDCTKHQLPTAPPIPSIPSSINAGASEVPVRRSLRT